MKNKYIVELNKPYEFEGKKYNQIDLSKIEDLSANDLLSIEKLYNQSGIVSPTPEMSLTYACLVASHVSNQPIEFFHGLPAKEAVKLKTAVVDFLYN